MSGPISDERERMKVMTAAMADYAEEGGMSNVDADQLRAKILGTYEAARAELDRLRAVLTQHERVLDAVFQDLHDAAKFGNPRWRITKRVVLLEERLRAAVLGVSA